MLTIEFQDLDKEFKSATKLPVQTPLTLDNLLAKARSLDPSELQATGIEKSLNSPDTVNHVQQKQHAKPQVAKPQHQHQHPGTCCQCGLTWPHMTTPRPAKGKTCRDCGKPNHFAKMCRSKPRAKPKYQHYQPRHQQNQKSVLTSTTSAPSTV